MARPRLPQLIALLRKNGVTHYREGDIEIQLGELPAKAAKAKDDKPEAPKLPDDLASRALKWGTR